MIPSTFKGHMIVFNIWEIYFEEDLKKCDANIFRHYFIYHNVQNIYFTYDGFSVWDSIFGDLGKAVHTPCDVVMVTVITVVSAGNNCLIGMT